MSIASPEALVLTMKQRVFIGLLGVLSVLLAALVVFGFNPAGEISEALPGPTSVAASVRGAVRSSFRRVSEIRSRAPRVKYRGDLSQCHEAEGLHGSGQLIEK